MAVKNIFLGGGGGGAIDPFNCSLAPDTLLEIMSMQINNNPSVFCPFLEYFLNVALICLENKNKWFIVSVCTEAMQ